MSSEAEVFGPYRVYEQLGIGGMATVHRAEQVGIEGFRKVVALKRMLPHMAANEEMVKSFVREARLASYLHHVNVAQTYELGKVGDVYFIAMELLEGRNLREMLRSTSAAQTRIPVSIALAIINQILDALDYAHNLCDDTGTPFGIIHRDVSPSNVIVTESGVVKLIDFGIAKVSAASMQTMSGVIKGKYGYMAPEYIAGSIDARADLFAVGVIAHELLTNRPLFTVADEMQTLMRVRELEVRPPSRWNPDVPQEVDDVVMTALERDPARRWQNATAMRTVLTTITKRLGLEITNQQLVEWVERALFELPTSRFQSSAYPTDDGISLSGDVLARPASEPPTRALKHSSPQPSPGPEQLTPNGLYAAAVLKYERHDALHPTGSFLSDDVVPTTVRPPGAHAVTPDPASETPAVPTPTTTPRTARPSASPANQPRSARPSAGPANQPGTARPSEPAPAERVDRAAVTALTPRTSGRLLAVFLVLLAAAIAATAVYFVLPLLTS